MFLAEPKVKSEANPTGSRRRRSPVGMNALFLLVILVSSAVLLFACGDDPTATPEPTPAPTATPEPTVTPDPTATPEPTAPPTATPEPEPVNEDDALTRAYVEKAIAYYDANGRDATIE